eukprot:1889773-Rhodomonas_salina.1
MEARKGWGERAEGRGSDILVAWVMPSSLSRSRMCTNASTHFFLCLLSRPQHNIQHDPRQCPG